MAQAGAQDRVVWQGHCLLCAFFWLVSRLGVPSLFSFPFLVFVLFRLGLRLAIRRHALWQGWARAAACRRVLALTTAAKSPPKGPCPGDPVLGQHWDGSGCKVLIRRNSICLYGTPEP